MMTDDSLSLYTVDHANVFVCRTHRFQLSELTFPNGAHMYRNDSKRSNHNVNQLAHCDSYTKRTENERKNN